MFPSGKKTMRHYKLNWKLRAQGLGDDNGPWRAWVCSTALSETTSLHFVNNFSIHFSILIFKENCNSCLPLK